MLDLTVRELLDETAAVTPPGGGSTAAFVGALAAALTAAAARASTEWDEAGAVVAQASRLRARLAELAPANEEAYRAALASLQLAVEARSRDAEIAEAMTIAAALPLAILTVVALRLRRGQPPASPRTAETPHGSIPAGAGRPG